MFTTIFKFLSQYIFPFVITFLMGLTCFISGVNVGSNYRAEQDELLMQKCAEEYKEIQSRYDFIKDANCLYIKDAEENE